MLIEPIIDFWLSKPGDFDNLFQGWNDLMVVFRGEAVVLNLFFAMLLLYPVFPSLPARTETQR